MMMYQIKTLNSISPVYAEVLKGNRYSVGADAENPDAIIVRSADMHGYIPGEKLLCVARAGAGYNNIPVEEMAEKGIVVFNTPGANANAVKELTLTGLLLASRRVVQGIEWCETIGDQGERVPELVEKEKSRFVGPELAGKTLGVIGLGAVGRLVANAAVGLQMRVLGNDPYISVDNAWLLSRAVEHSTDMDMLYASCDYISVHVPLTDSSRGMFGRETFAKMKDGAVLLNFSRGGLVDNTAVREALESGKLRAYVTDFPSAELIGVPGVLCIPHLGASTPESEDNCVRMAAREISEYLQYGSIRNSVNYPACQLGPVKGARMLIMHRNIPNVIQGVLKLVTESGENLNIDNMVNKSRGSYAYTVLEFDRVPSQNILDAVSRLEPCYRVRLLLPEES